MNDIQEVIAGCDEGSRSTSDNDGKLSTAKESVDITSGYSLNRELGVFNESPMESKGNKGSGENETDIRVEEARAKSPDNHEDGQEEEEEALADHTEIGDGRNMGEEDLNEDLKDSNHGKAAHKEFDNVMQPEDGHTIQPVPDTPQGNDILIDPEGHSPSGDNRLRDEDDEYSHSDIVRRTEPLRHDSYHDSDSDLIDYDYDDGRSIPGVDSDIGDADSWDWTFPDENVNEIDARTRRIHLTPRNTKYLSNISESDVSETQEERLCDPSDKTDSGNAVSGVHESSDTKAVYHSNQTPDVLNVSGAEEGMKQLESPPQETANVNDTNSLFCGQPRLYHDGKRKQTGIEENVVYFEDLKSSQVLKTRLRYLYDNSDVGSATSRVRKNLKRNKIEETSRKKKISPKVAMYRQNARKQFEHRNVRRRVSKLNAIESRFFTAGHSYFYDDPDFPPIGIDMDSPENGHLMSSIYSLSLSLSLPKSDFTLPPVIINDKKRPSLPRKRHSLNDDLTERLISWRMSRGRAMSRPDVFRKSLTKEQMQRDVDDLIALRRREQRTPLEKFRHAGRMIVMMLRAVGLKPVKAKEENYNFLSWTVMYDEVLGISRLNYDSGNLSFDPLLYKANKECTISDDVKDILRLPSDQRSDAQIHSVLMCFQNVVPSFSEFPIRIQQSMVKVCTYEKFETGRVIIRQGHRAENFYFILSGCAVVTEMDSDANHVYTTNVLGKGNSFGELAFLNMSKRSATVTCREDVELICIEREDFIDIFMRKVKGKEPEHITFLKKVELLKEWPVWLLPHDNPKICAFTYVRRGVILCHDSDKSDWLIVVVSGSCKILKALNDKPVRAYSEDRRPAQTHKIKLATPGSNFSKIYTTMPNNNNNSNSNINYSNSNHRGRGQQRQENQQQQQQQSRVRRHGAIHTDTTISLDMTHSLGDRKEDDTEMAQIEHLAKINSIYYRKHVLPSIHKMKREDPQDSSPHKVSSRRLEPPPVTPLFRPKRQSYGLQPPALPQLVVPETRPLQKKVFIEITRLEPGDVFGLEHVLLRGMRDVTSCSLVSEGAEVVLISKKFFKKHLTEEAAKRIRQMIRPLPSEKTLQQNLNTKKSWEAFKAYTVARHSYGKDRVKAPLQT